MPPDSTIAELVKMQFILISATGFLAEFWSQSKLLAETLAG